MRTIILTDKKRDLYGGRPQKIGSTVFTDEVAGIHCGYDHEGNKIIIPIPLFQKLLKNNQYMRYLLEVRLKPRKSSSLINKIKRVLTTSKK